MFCVTMSFIINRFFRFLFSCFTANLINSTPIMPVFILWLLTVIIGISLLYVTACIIIKRLRDEELSCWFVVPALILDWWVCSYLWLPLCLLKGKTQTIQ